MRRTSLCRAMTCRPDPGDGQELRRETAQGLQLCPSCRDRLARDVGLLPQLYGELESALASTAAAHHGEKVRGSRTPGIPLNEKAADARSDIRGVLTAWVDLVVEGRRLTAPARTVPALAAFLGCHLDWLAAHEAAGEAAREIHELARTARRVARPDRVHLIRLGECVEPACSGSLQARVNDGDWLLPAAIVCNIDSSHSWPPSQWHVVRKRMRVAS